MDKNINWKNELLSSGRFNKKEEKLLKFGAKSIAQSWWLQSLYFRWKNLKGLNQKNLKENKGQLQSSFKEYSKKMN